MFSYDVNTKRVLCMIGLMLSTGFYASDFSSEKSAGEGKFFCA